MSGSPEGGTERRVALRSLVSGAEVVVDLTGQVALVTGGGRGIGRAIALALAQAGAAVAVVARTSDQVAATAREITELGGRALALTADVAVRREIEAAVAATAERLGPIDLLVNNAGVSGPLAPLAEIDPDDWWRTLEVNVRGPLVAARAVLPGMRQRRRGRIVNVASGAGTFAIPNFSAYVVSKTALLRLTECLAADGKDDGIAVFSLQPGAVRTALAEEILGSPEASERAAWFGKIFAAGRDVPPELAARLVVALAAGHADALSGRLLDAQEDFADLVARSGEIVAGDLYTLRCRRLPR